MIKASIDRPKLEKSLKRFAKDFGDTNAQAVCRWGVRTCVEMAGETLPWKSKGKGNPRIQQKTAIERDLGRVVSVMETIPKKSENTRLLKSAEDCIAWMDENRGRNRRTKKLPVSERKLVSRAIFAKTVSTLMVKAGIAKGGFIGAGQELAKAQRGTDRIHIGKNVFSYAQKHAPRFGSATIPRSGFKPSATVSNRAAHTGLEYVLKKTASRRAIEWGLKKTVAWYRAALRRQNQQQKP